MRVLQLRMRVNLLLLESLVSHSVMKGLDPLPWEDHMQKLANARGIVKLANYQSTNTTVTTDSGQRIARGGLRQQVEV